MTIDLDQLRAAAAVPVAPSTTNEGVLWARGRRRRTLRRATTGVAAGVVLVAGVSSATALIASPGPSAPEVATTRGDDLPPPVTDDVAGPPDREPEAWLLRAVAPFDHEGAVDRADLADRVTYLENVELAACLRDVGEDVADPEPPAPVDRDDRGLEEYRDGAFPHTDRLAEEGLPYFRSEPADLAHVPPGTLDLREVDFDVVVACQGGRPDVDLRLRSGDDGGFVLEDLSSAPPALHPAGDLHRELAVAWSAVLEEVEVNSEIHDLRDDLGACLLDAGVPAAHASAEDFFGYANTLRAAAMDAAGDDAVDDQRTIMREQGQLWATCGRDLFEARERLRSGEPRTAFLQRHATSIVELATYLDEVPEAR